MVKYLKETIIFVKAATLGLMGDKVKRFNIDRLYDRVCDQAHRHGMKSPAWSVYIAAIHSLGHTLSSENIKDDIDVIFHYPNLKRYKISESFEVIDDDMPSERRAEYREAMIIAMSVYADTEGKNPKIRKLLDKLLNDCNR